MRYCEVPVQSVDPMRKITDRDRQLFAQVIRALPAFVPLGREAEKRGTFTFDDLAPLADAGLLQLYRPEEYGGWQMLPSDFFRLTVKLAEASPSIAWSLMLFIKHNLMLTRYPRRIQKVLFKSDPLLLSSSAYKPGSGKRVSGGYEVSGDWKYVTGVNVANWVVLPVLLPSGAKLDCFAPLADFEVVEDWDMIGMQASETHILRADKLFVSDAMTYDPGSNPVSGEEADLYSDVSHAAVVILGTCAPMFGAFQRLLELYRQRCMAVEDRNRKLDMLKTYQAVAMEFDLVSAAVNGSLPVHDYNLDYPAPAPNPHDQRYLSSRFALSARKVSELAGELFCRMGTQAARRHGDAARLYGDIMTLSTHYLLDIDRILQEQASQHYLAATRKRGPGK